MNRWLLRPQAKPLLFATALLPFAFLLWGAVADTLGPNPAEALIRGTGDWTLRFLCLTLAITPLRQATGWHALARLRRMLGLFAFFYAVWHFVGFAWLEMGFDFAAILRDIPKRPFILAGSTAALVMLPLALTSSNRAIRRLGPHRWQALHRGVYVAIIAALVHFYWMRAAKRDFAEVSVYATIVAGLLGWRLLRWLRSRRRARVPPAPF